MLRIYENAAGCPVLWTGMNGAVLRFGRQDILVLHCIFAEARLRCELSRTKALAIREAPPQTFYVKLFFCGWINLSSHLLFENFIL